MDQDVLEMIKKKCHRRLLRSLISAANNNENYITAPKKNDLLDAIRWRGKNIAIARACNILLDNKKGLKPALETEVEDENNKLLSMLKHIPSSDDGNAEDIT